jgi:hypothetical protein
LVLEKDQEARRKPRFFVALFMGIELGVIDALIEGRYLELF